MNDIKNICVYSASSTKIDPVYFEAAEELGKILAQKHINLINGAGCLGPKEAVNLLYTIPHWSKEIRKFAAI